VSSFAQTYRADCHAGCLAAQQVCAGTSAPVGPKPQPSRHCAELDAGVLSAQQSCFGTLQPCAPCSGRRCCMVCMGCLCGPSLRMFVCHALPWTAWVGLLCLHAIHGPPGYDCLAVACYWALHEAAVLLFRGVHGPPVLRLPVQLQSSSRELLHWLALLIFSLFPGLRCCCCMLCTGRLHVPCLASPVLCSCIGLSLLLSQCNLHAAVFCALC
jgi:hypothetical protein